MAAKLQIDDPELSGESGWDDDEGKYKDADRGDVFDPTQLTTPQQVPDLDPVSQKPPEEQKTVSTDTPPGETADETPELSEEEQAAVEAAKAGGEAAAGALEAAKTEDEPWKPPFLAPAQPQETAMAQELAALRQELTALREHAPKDDPAAQLDTQQTQIEQQIEQLDEQRDGLLADGKTEELSRVDRQVRRLERKLDKLEMGAHIEQLTQRQQEQLAQLQTQTAQDRAQSALDDKREELLGQFPCFDPTAAEYHQGMEKEVLTLYDGLYRAGGRTAPQALEAAVLYVTKAAGVLPKGQNGTAPSAPDARRKEETVRRNAAIASRTPPDLGDTGLRSTRKGKTEELPDASKLTDEELAALPEKVRARMRGDIL